MSLKNRKAKYNFDFEDAIRQALNDKMQALDSSIQSLREAKSKNDKAIKERIEASEKSCDKVKKDLDSVQKIAEDRKSKLKQLLDNSIFKFIEVDNTTEENRNKLRKVIKENENERDKHIMHVHSCYSFVECYSTLFQ